MDNFDDIKGLWQSAGAADLPEPGEIRDKVRRYRRRMLWRKGSLMTLAVLASVMLALLLFVSPQPPVRYAANGVFLCSWLFLLVSGFRSFRRAQRVKDQDNKAFLRYLEEGQAGRIRYYKYTLPVILSFNSAALLLYTPLSMAGYAVLIAYLLLLWFVVRPRQFKKKQRHYEALREKLERISQQL